MNIRKGRHCVYELHAHIVFVTKYRGKVFDGHHLTTLESLFVDICESFEVDLVEFNGEQDHIHLLVNFPPKVQLSKLVNSLKGVSSRKLKQYHPESLKPAYANDALWSPSYYVGSVGGGSIRQVKAYIENQARPAV